MVLVIKQKDPKKNVPFTDDELKLLTNIALITVLINFALNFASAAVGSALLWSDGNPFGLILIISVATCFMGYLVLKPVWNMAVRHLGGGLQTIDQIRSDILLWLNDRYRKMSYRFFILAQVIVGAIAVQRILAMANDKCIFIITSVQSEPRTAQVVAGTMVVIMELLVLMSSLQLSKKEESDITIEYKK